MAPIYDLNSKLPAKPASPAWQIHPSFLRLGRRRAASRRRRLDPTWRPGTRYLPAPRPIGHRLGRAHHDGRASGGKRSGWAVGGRGRGRTALLDESVAGAPLLPARTGNSDWSYGAGGRDLRGAGG